MPDAQRTSPADALLNVAQWLNFHSGSTVSINELARATGLAWATVRKYVDVLQRLQFALPGLQLAKDGVQVDHRGLAFEEALSSPVTRNVFALWMLQRVHDLEQGIPATRLDLEDELKDLESLGFVVRTEKGCLLTDAGYSLANSIYGDYLAFSHSDDLHAVANEAWDRPQARASSRKRSADE